MHGVLLNDPVGFAQDTSRELQRTDLDGVLIDDAPKQIDDLRTEFEYMFESDLRRDGSAAASDVLTAYTEFVTYALGQAQQYGIALGAVLEQFRAGLVRVADLSRRGFIYGDVSTLNDLQQLWRKRNPSPSTGYAKSDLEHADKEQAREERRTQAA